MLSLLESHQKELNNQESKTKEMMLTEQTHTEIFMIYKHIFMFIAKYCIKKNCNNPNLTIDYKIKCNIEILDKISYILDKLFANIVCEQSSVANVFGVEGTMGSGKSLFLGRLNKHVCKDGKKMLVILPKNARNGNLSRCEFKLEPEIKRIKHFSEITDKEFAKYNTFAIDELQLWPEEEKKEIYKFINRCKELKKTTVIVGLRYNIFGEPFNSNINKLLNDVDLSYKKPAICELFGKIAGNTLFYNRKIYKEHKFGEPFIYIEDCKHPSPKKEFYTCCKKCLLHNGLNEIPTIKKLSFVYIKIAFNKMKNAKNN